MHIWQYINLFNISIFNKFQQQEQFWFHQFIFLSKHFKPNFKKCERIFWRILFSDKISNYSEPPNTRLSGIQMVIFRTVFGSGFWMLKTRWLPNLVFKWSAIFLPFENRTGPFFTTSLDRFITKHFLFMTFFK
jgi:hypothetical protein